MRKTSIILSIAALILSLLSLYIACIDPQKDWSANLIATLGVLCTVLIGWQIFSFIDFRSYEKKMNELEKRLIEDEKRILITQENIITSQESFIESQKRLLSTQETIAKVYHSISKGEGAIYEGIANIYHYLKDFNSFSPSDFLCQEITWLISDLEVMLGIYSQKELRGILSKIQGCLNSNISLNSKQRDLLAKQIDHMLKAFEKTSKATDPKLREILDEARRLVQSISKKSL